jgi:hypothetical protein
MNSTTGIGMNGPLLLLITCYALLALILLALCLYTRWSAWIKTLAILVTGGFFVLTYDSMTGLLGFPSPGKLPNRFMFHYAVVQQPDKNTSNKGAIYFWATEMTPDGPTKLPRAYELPYDKDTYNQLTEANKRTKQGIVQMGQTQELPTGPSTNTFTKYMSGGKQQKIRMMDMPEPSLPEK